jgi:hypothetical protein
MAGSRRNEVFMAVGRRLEARKPRDIVLALGVGTEVARPKWCREPVMKFDREPV